MAHVDRQLAFYWRGELRYRRRVDQAALRSEPTIDYRDTYDEALDVQKAIASLPEFAQQVCSGARRHLQSAGDLEEFHRLMQRILSTHKG